MSAKKQVGKLILEPNALVVKGVRFVWIIHVKTQVRNQRQPPKQQLVAQKGAGLFSIGQVVLAAGGVAAAYGQQRAVVKALHAHQQVAFAVYAAAGSQRYRVYEVVGRVAAGTLLVAQARADVPEVVPDIGGLREPGWAAVGTAHCW